MGERLADGIGDIAFGGGLLSAVALRGLSQAVEDAGHAEDIRHAQGVVDRMAMRERQANADFHAVVARLDAAMHENAVLRSALAESDGENLRLSIEIGALRRAH